MGLLGAADLGVAKAFLEEVAINPTIELLSRRTYMGLGKQALGRPKPSLMSTRTQEKGAVTPQETDLDLPIECPGVSGRGIGQWRPAAGSRALNATVHAQDLWKEMPIIFITSTIVWSQVKQQEGSTVTPINKKLG